MKFKKRRSALHAVLRVRHDEVDRTLHLYMHLGLARYERRIQAPLAPPLTDATTCADDLGPAQLITRGMTDGAWGTAEVSVG